MQWDFHALSKNTEFWKKLVLVKSNISQSQYWIGSELIEWEEHRERNNGTCFKPFVQGLDIDVSEFIGLLMSGAVVVVVVVVSVVDVVDVVVVVASVSVSVPVNVIFFTIYNIYLI